MTITDMESRLQSLKNKIAQELRLLQREPGDGKQPNKANVSRMLLEVGALHMRLLEAGRRS